MILTSSDQNSSNCGILGTIFLKSQRSHSAGWVLNPFIRWFLCYHGHRNPSSRGDLVKRFGISGPLWWALFLVGVLAVHFFITFWYLTPNNPVKSKWWDSLYAYMDPLFTQNWKLFAPNPVSQHQDVWAKARVKNPANGQVQETDWQNITAPMIQEKQPKRISSEDRILRQINVGARQFRSKDPKEKQEGEWILQRSASTALGQALPDSHLSQVKIRVVTNLFPRFQNRHKGDDETPLHFQESGWLKYQPADPSPAKEWPE